MRVYLIFDSLYASGWRNEAPLVPSSSRGGQVRFQLLQLTDEGALRCRLSMRFVRSSKGLYFVKAATLLEMLQRTCREEFYQEEDARAILLCYRQFTSPITFLKALTCIYKLMLHKVKPCAPCTVIRTCHATLGVSRQLRAAGSSISSGSFVSRVFRICCLQRVYRR
jgi:hypothetical protein